MQKNGLLFLFSALALSACSQMGTSPVTEGSHSSSVRYGDPRDVETITTNLGSTDIQMTTEKMVKSLLQHPQMQEIIRRRLLVVASPVENKTSEYFDTQLITDAIKVQLQKNGVRYAVAEGRAMKNQESELIRQNQSGLYKKSASAKIGNMSGARFRLDGSVSSIIKKNSSTKDAYYVITLELVDIEEGVSEWSDSQEIRKTKPR
ncbi:MAG: penicillin-binding protein activator LpoB [Zoogloeaceae bacterium]|jgi:uncharacterized protein (TIGR02722 family)|nr:penicillin-binding protein activator LpoB [Zoogloeaceae bacterium]